MLHLSQLRHQADEDYFSFKQLPWHAGQADERKFQIKHEQCQVDGNIWHHAANEFYVQ